MTDLDNILSGQGEAAPEENTATQVVTEGQQAEGEQQVDASEQGEPQRQKMVPHEAYHAEKQKTKRYTEEVSNLRSEIAERDAAWERRIAQLMEAQKPKQEPQQKPDWYENPDAAMQHSLQQTVSPQFDQMTQMIMANARLVATSVHGQDKMDAAIAAFDEAVASGKIDAPSFQNVRGSANPFDAAVRWHQRQLAQAEIGDDPAAYRAKVEAEIREKVLAELNGGQPAQQTQQRQPVMPSNLAGARNVGARGGPAWSGPPSLQDIFNRTPATG